MRTRDGGSAQRQLDATTFDALLSQLGSDSTKAALRYEQLRDRLIVFFLRRLAPSPEDLADQVIDRLARRLAEGEVIASIEAYALGIARFVVMEQAALQRKEVSPDGEFLANIRLADTTLSKEAIEREHELVAMEHCLASLPKADLELLNTYYLPEGQSRIVSRRRLAERLNISSGALRARIFLICKELRSCIRSRASTGNPSKRP
jgi:DNA-directed RNA polymerase specialized sigma24 family protein